MPEAFCGFETVRKWVLLDLCALWEKSLPQLLSNILFLTERHRWTEHTAFHRALAGGRTHRTLQPILAETLCVLCMPEAFCGLEMCAKKLRELCALCERKNFQWTNACAKNALLNLWVLWEIIHPSDLLGCHLIARVRSLSHRVTQKNRTHKVAQRH